MSTKQACIDIIGERIEGRVASMAQEVSELSRELEAARVKLHASYPERVRSVWTLLGENDYPSQPKETNRSGSYSLSKDELARVLPHKKRVELIRERMAYMQARHDKTRGELDGMREAITAIRLNVDEVSDV